VPGGLYCHALKGSRDPPRPLPYARRFDDPDLSLIDIVWAERRIREALAQERHFASVRVMVLPAVR